MAVRRLAALLLAATSLALTLAAPARAATVSVADGRMTFTAAPGEDNYTRVTAAGGAIEVQDVVAVATGAGCATVSATQATCAGVTAITLALGDVSDDANVSDAVTVPVRAEDGSERDWVTGGGGHTTFTNGTGDDELFAGAGGATFLDGPGWNSFYGGSGATPSATPARQPECP